MLGIDAADSHQGGHDRNLKCLREFAQSVGGTPIDDAAAGINHRPLRGAQCGKETGAGRLRQLARLEAIHPLPITWNGQTARTVENALPVLHVLRDIEDHGAGSAGACDLERRAHGGLQLGRIGDQKYMLRHGAHDARHRRFLECIGADGRGGHLAANHHDGHRIRHAVAHRSYHIRGAGTGSDQRDADATAGPREPRRHEPGALLVGRNDERHRGGVILVVAEYRVVNRQNRAAAVAENGVDALVGQDLDQHVRARHAGAGQRVGSLIQHVVAVFHPQSLAVLALAPKCRPGAHVPPWRPSAALPYPPGPCVTSSPSSCRTKPARSPESPD